MDKTLTLTLTGPGELVDACLDLFARWHGWTDDPPAWAEPRTREEAARLALRSYMIESAKAEAARQASVAVAAAAGQAEAVAASLTLILAVEEPPE